LGDTIRVSLTEPPEEEIDPCTRLANLGMRAAELQKGVVWFKTMFQFDIPKLSNV
jgi:(E)-4-hydroxy-3-methylbut-2-enyl-diphosphate synthase